MRAEGSLDVAARDTASDAAHDELVEACLTRYGQMMRALLHARASSGLFWNQANVTLPQIRVLSLLMSREDGLSGRELAMLLGVGPSAVTPLIDRLVEHGYVRREEDRADRRITRAILTPAGAAVLQQLGSGRREVLADALQGLDPEELAVVERAFALIHDGLQRARPSPDLPERTPPSCPRPPRRRPASPLSATTSSPASV
jgi:DNA-binding MarR family transcriptional regulator